MLKFFAGFLIGCLFGCHAHGQETAQLGTAQLGTAQLGTAQFLSFPDQASALAYSAAKCQAMGCDGTFTKYWWQVTGPDAQGRYAVMIEAAPRLSGVDFSASSVPAGDQAQLTGTFTATTALPAQ